MTRTCNKCQRSIADTGERLDVAVCCEGCKARDRLQRIMAVCRGHARQAARDIGSRGLAMKVLDIAEGL